MSAVSLFGFDSSLMNHKALRAEDVVLIPTEAMKIFSLFQRMQKTKDAVMTPEIEKQIDESVDYFQSLCNRVGIRLNVQVVLKRLLELMTQLQPFFPQWKDTDADGNKVEPYFYEGEPPRRLVKSLVANYSDVAAEIANNPEQMWGTIAQFVPPGDRDGDDQDRVAYSQHMWIRDLFRRVVKEVNPDAWEAAKQQALQGKR